MTSIFRAFTTIAAVGLLALGSQHATAGSVTCPASSLSDNGTVTTTGSDYSTVDSLVPTCAGAGDGSTNEYLDFFGDDYELISKDEGNAIEGAVADALNMETYDSGEGDFGNSGTYTIDYSGLGNFTDIVFILKRGGGGSIVNEWIAFDLDGSAQGLWELFPDGQALSHGALIGIGTLVPIPAAAWLFGSALVGLAGIGYRRKSAA